MLLFLAARFTHFNTVTEILVPMIGLGVGIDYTLFIVTRFRQYLHDGLPPQEAAAAAERDRRPAPCSSPGRRLPSRSPAWP